jgi:hypothetical protein
MMKKILLGSALTASFLLVGCGGGSSDTVSTTTDTIGYVVDSAVANLDYDCIADGVNDKVTGADGAFTCQNMNQVRFRIGELVLGEITALPQDGYVLPQDIVGVPREQVTDAKVTAMAQLLQSLDSDDNLANGITIPQDVKALMPTETLSASDVQTYLASASINPMKIRSQIEAQNHLRETMRELNQYAGSNSGINTGFDINNYPMSTLTPELEETIVYMGNEERFAYDIYTNLYNYYANQGIEIRQLFNISTQAEVAHIDIVQSIVHRYDLNATDVIDNPVADSSATLNTMPSGEYGIPEIQDLYDTLYAKGTQSQQDALEVGCMVEVTDINDLTNDISIAEDANAIDIIAAYTVLRDGSYNHYWAFDTGLKNMGVSDGCCSLGTIDGVNYCHPEYPQNENGNTTN